jgi:hypothetical protein
LARSTGVGELKIQTSHIFQEARLNLHFVQKTTNAGKVVGGFQLSACMLLSPPISVKL